MNVTLAAENLFYIGSFGVTNALFSAFLIFIFLIISIILIARGISYDKPSKFQLVLEMIVGMLFGMVKDILGEERAKSLFGFLFTFVVFILVSNWFGLLPFVPSMVISESEHETKIETKAQKPETILASTEKGVAVTEEKTTEKASEKASEKVAPPTFGECIKNKNCYLTTSGVVAHTGKSVHIFRAPTSDLSFTAALAIISLVVTNYLGFAALKLGHLKRYIDLSNPLNTFIGLVELLSEVSKLLSFSFRLFGNIFAGEMLLAVMTSLTYGVLTLPFLALELFVGVIQAFVFFMLTTVFISVATTKQH